MFLFQFRSSTVLDIYVPSGMAREMNLHIGEKVPHSRASLPAFQQCDEAELEYYAFVLSWVARPAAHLHLHHDHESNFQIAGDPRENLQILQSPLPQVHLPSNINGTEIKR